MADKNEVLKNKIKDHARKVRNCLTATAVAVSSAGVQTVANSEFVEEIQGKKRASLEILTSETVKTIVKEGEKGEPFKSFAVASKTGEMINDFKDATEHSIWDVTFMREVSNQENPVGVFNEFGGAMQYNAFNANNMILYALLKPEFSNIGEKFLIDNPNFKAQFEEFKEQYDKNGNDVFHYGNKNRNRMIKFLIKGNNFKDVFSKEGKNNSENFLRLQRDFATDVYTSFDRNSIAKILAELDKSNIKIQDVSWPIIGMWASMHIAYGGFKGVEQTLKGKSLEQINSVEYVNELADKNATIFKKGSGLLALNFVKENLNTPPSITIFKEVSDMFGVSVLDEYLKVLSENQNRKITWNQALALVKNKQNKFNQLWYANNNLNANA